MTPLVGNTRKENKHKIKMTTCRSLPIASGMTKSSRFIGSRASSGSRAPVQIGGGALCLAHGDSVPFASVQTSRLDSEDARAVREQFEVRETNDKLREGYLIANPEKNSADAPHRNTRTEGPPLKQIKRHFEQSMKRVHALLNFHKSYIAHAPARQRVALDQWQQTSSDINAFLRTGKLSIDFCAVAHLTPNKQDTSREITRAIRKAVSPDDIKFEMNNLIQKLKGLRLLVKHAPRLKKGSYTLYRGVGIPVPFTSSKTTAPELGAKKGDTLSWPGFSSFSISPLVALDFFQAPCCVFTLTWNRRVPGLVIPLNGRYSEFEVIVPPGRFRVRDVRYVQSTEYPDRRLRVLDLEWV